MTKIALDQRSFFNLLFLFFCLLVFIRLSLLGIFSVFLVFCLIFFLFRFLFCCFLGVFLGVFLRDLIRIALFVSIRILISVG